MLSLSKKCKKHNIKSVRELSLLSNVAEATLYRWYKDKGYEECFSHAFYRALRKKEREE